MKNLKEHLAKFVAKAVDEFVDFDLYEWPPTCNGLLAQPMRPKAISIESKETEHER